MENILEKINRSALKFMAAETREEMYRVIVKEGIKLVNADDGAICLKTGRDLEIVYGSNEHISATKPRKNGYIYRCVTKKEAFIIHAEEFKEHHPEVEEYGVKSTIFIPLFYQTKSIGSLVVRTFKQKVLSERELEILKIYGSMASLNIRNAQLLDQTKEALKMRDLFMSLASHELKTPLTAITGYVQLLQKKYNETETKEAKWVDNLFKETKRLTKLIRELLEVNQIQINEFQFNFVDCNIFEIIERSIESFKFGHPNRNIKEIREDIKNTILIGDSDKLMQVITNILNNAAKFSEENTTIQLFIKEDKNNITIMIKDSGQGIKQEDLPHIFEGFYKGKHTVREGLGLGLYIANVIIDKHKGKIEIESEENKGTEVKIILPLKKT